MDKMQDAIIKMKMCACVRACVRACVWCVGACVCVCVHYIVVYKTPCIQNSATVAVAFIYKMQISWGEKMLVWPQICVCVFVRACVRACVCV